MNDFKPSEDFTARVMHAVERYEMTARKGSFAPRLFSKPAFLILSAGGILLGVINLIRMAQLLFAPALCF
jgi:hypothetical protein